MFLVYLSVVLVLFIIWLKFTLNYWDRRGIPGPKPWPIIGNIGPHLLGKKTLGQVMGDVYRKYAGYPFVGVFRSTTPVLLVRDPELVNQILVKNFKSFRNNELYVDKKSDELLGRNPFVLRDQEWKDTRQMLTPGMTSGKMKSMYPLIEDITAKFVKYIQNHPTANTDGIETRGLTKRLTLDYVAKAAFGIDGKSFESYDDISEFNKLANKFLSPGTISSLVFALANIFPVIMKMNILKFVAKDVEVTLMKIVSEVVKHRRENNIKANDYLQFLIELADEKKFGDIEITSYASTFFIDGYETSSLVLTFLLFNLAFHPEYQKKIRNDIKKYESENNGKLTYEAVHEMPWLNACLYESVRYTPPIETLTKLCTEYFEYTPTNPDFKKITAKLVPGDIVVLPYGFVSRDRKYFEDPDKFIPERMFNKDAFEKGTYFPFGEGPRACIGQRLGIMQTKLGAAHILKQFELSVSPKLQQPINYYPYHMFNEVKGGFWIKYKKIGN